MYCYIQRFEIISAQQNILETCYSNKKNGGLVMQCFRDPLIPDAPPIDCLVTVLMEEKCFATLFVAMETGL